MSYYWFLDYSLPENLSIKDWQHVVDFHSSLNLVISFIIQILLADKSCPEEGSRGWGGYIFMGNIHFVMFLVPLNCCRSDFHFQMKIQGSWKVSPESSVARCTVNVTCISIDSVIFLEWSWQLIFNYPCMTYHTQLACCDGRGKVTWHLNCAVNRDLQEAGRLYGTWAKTGESVCLNTPLHPLQPPLPGKGWQRSWLLAWLSAASAGSCAVWRVRRWLQSPCGLQLLLYERLTSPRAVPDT